ncbi:PH, RCC1 and FYVE domains-containing protein 1-like [Bidens hawaiensis]|uniref:PH, RCC1 and FYVE domains-containing protein 1-like n=1 Tax=Bidens hawaiensis TaxID=980011 RepID=UPI00404A7196
MTDPDRDIEQALNTLKKGTQLIKYTRKGKPKFRLFRISTDETTLIWYSHGRERNLNLASVIRIIPGQRTLVFKRCSQPEKEYLSFSLIYKNGERSLDLICKDKVEVDVWLAGLRHLVSSAQNRTRRSGSDISDGRPSSVALECDSSNSRGSFSVDLRYPENISSFLSSDVATGRANMQVRTSCADNYRISVSNTPSCSTQTTAAPDDIESLGDVYLWGKVCCFNDGTSQLKGDTLTPKLLESNVVIDVQQIACGVSHFSLVTKQGEIFTCGEESGGRLGHGTDRNVSRPRVIEFLSVNNVDFVACGEHHTCAVSSSGDLYTWGDGTHNAGLLGHGTDVSHWIPKQVSGPLEGIQVLSVACGNWHSAVITSEKKLYTFGDGTYGALGHGNRESVKFPKEVASLNGQKTLKVACGLWHTAAVVEALKYKTKNKTSKKLFTWGDGDKYRLGHGNKETYTEPTCVVSLTDHNFHQLACGHTMTVGLTTSGHVFTMGSTAHGQLGNPQADGKSPSMVQDKLVGEFVEEIACGAYHVAVLTSGSEVFTWGKGANGRLGHGDVEDRNTPTLVEALKDRTVKSLSCGANFTNSICIHKWASGVDQSVCHGCKQAFGFTRKRRNCYNCGLVHCHGCSSRKAMKAAMAPTSEKPHRVCDSCYVKLKKSAETGNDNSNTNNNSNNVSTFNRRFNKRTSKPLISQIMEPVKYHEVKSGKCGSRSNSTSMVRTSQVPSFQNLKDVSFQCSVSVLHSTWKPGTMTPKIHAGPRRPNPPSTTTPNFSRGVTDDLKKSNEHLSQQVSRLQNQVKQWKQKSDKQDSDIRKLQTAAKQAESLAADESAKCAIAVDGFKCIISQLNELAEKMPPEISNDKTIKDLIDKANDYIYTHGSDTSSSRAPLRSYEPGGSSSNHNIDENNESSSNNTSDAESQNIVEGSSGMSRNPNRDRGREVIEQFEAGVYVTVLQLSDGTKVFNRVRFSRRRFNEQQAEEWWRENRDRLFQRYSPRRPSGSSSVPRQPAQENNQEPPPSN